MMCECVPSSLSLSLSLYTGLTQSNWNTTSRRGNAHPAPHRYSVRKSSSSSSLSYHSSKCFGVSPNSSMLGSEDFDVYGELGFEDSEKDLFELKTALTNVVEPMEVSHENDLKLAENLVAETAEGVGSKVKKSAKSNGRQVFRIGRQIMRRSSMIAKQVISIQSALCLGFVSQLWVDTNSWILVAVEVKPTLLSGEAERFLLEDVSQVGDVVLVQDEHVLEKEFKTIGMETLVGYNVITTGHYNIGKVRGFTFNINSGAVETLELDSFGLSIIPSSLVSTYALFVEDVLEVVSDKVVVHENAASRIQRLTKGFWDAQNARIPGEEPTEISEMERQSLQDHNRIRKKRSSCKKFKSNARDSKENDWELPMDYL
ncbi:hypothetical protein RJ641_024457 [Dillenia turbinata]|uniref:PRC-barrel domain-containing protein n=1 Tax=Dillenia turbinata TaxID=194707 RepID=A0AAN8VZR2_9MAGN